MGSSRSSTRSTAAGGARGPYHKPAPRRWVAIEGTLPMPISQTCLKVRDFGRKIKSWFPPPFHDLRTLKHPLFLPPLVALLVKKSGAITAAHIACREPLKTLMAVRRTVFFVLFVDPWRIEPKMCHDLHLSANLNKLQQCGKICTEKYELPFTFSSSTITQIFFHNMTRSSPRPKEADDHPPDQFEHVSPEAEASLRPRLGLPKRPWRVRRAKCLRMIGGVVTLLKEAHENSTPRT
jgi:hypothetical protein